MRKRTCRDKAGPFRIAILSSHPIQYFAPMYRRLAESPDLDINVLYCSKVGVEGTYDGGFGREVKWDVPLLEGYRHKFLRNLRRKNSVLGFFSLINLGVVKELWAGGYDAVWIHGHAYLTNIVAIATAKAFGIRVLMRCDTHLGLQRGRIKAFLRKPLMTVFYKFCDGFLAIGQLNERFYLAHGAPKHKVFSVPFTVNNDFFISSVAKIKPNQAEIRLKLGVLSAPPVILFAAKLIALKRPDDLIDAYVQLREKGLSAQLVFVGSGPLDGGLKARVAAEGIPDVFFLGFKNQSELLDCYAIADIFVLPSENEAWGLVVNEAMCSGLPIIVTRAAGSAADLVSDGGNGYVIEVGDLTALTCALVDLVEDSALRDVMGARSLRRISEWDYRKDVEGVVTAMRQLICS